MARIGKAEHARILHLASVEGRKVAEIAAEYGCSTANIYALLGKLRRAVPAAPPVEPVAASEAAAPRAVLELAAEVAPLPDASVVDLFALPPKPPQVEKRAAPSTPPASREPAPAARVRPPPRAAAPAKPGYGLTMRSPEGEDSVAPFRSLEDLLGAIKPILRAAATSAEPVWFCIQPVDLATLEEDAA